LRDFGRILKERDAMKEECKVKAENLWKTMEDPKKRVIGEVFT